VSRVARTPAPTDARPPEAPSADDVEPAEGPPRIQGASTLGRWVRQGLVHAPSVVAGAAVVAIGSAPVAIAWYAASRFAYVVFAGISLSVETDRRALSRVVGGEAAWRTFRDRVSWLMDNDAAAFLALAIVTASTLGDVGIPSLVLTLVGVALVVLGLGIKLWATMSLPPGAYHWRDFFVRDEARDSARGPYRFLADPMYTLGYAHVYGVALLLRSVPGLIAAVAGQALMLLLNVLVEQRADRAVSRDATGG
jgi:protein-S-isoprenylcysteine O-methyltransferase Ste14